MKVEDINAVITGGASGLGKATAEIIIKILEKLLYLTLKKKKAPSL